MVSGPEEVDPLTPCAEDPEKNEGLLGLGLPAIGLPAIGKSVGSPIDSPYEVVSPTKLVIE